MLHIAVHSLSHLKLLRDVYSKTNRIFTRSKSIGLEILSNDNRANCISRLSDQKRIGITEEKAVKKAAVLVPLCITNGTLSFLYTLRAFSLKSYRGQVSFPGGLKDLHDRNLEETAIRETEEELGIRRKNIDVWGHGNYVGSALRDVAVLPYLGFIGYVDPRKLKLNPTEVQTAFAVPLETLCNPQHQKYTRFRGQCTLPVFVGDDFKIWGITAIITHVMLMALLPTRYHRHSVLT